MGTTVAVLLIFAARTAFASELCPKDCPSVCVLSQLREGACDARGECILLPAHACAGGFACLDESTCARDCANDGQCASGYVCDDRGSFTCSAAPLVCDGRFLSRDDDNASSQIDCAPYACRGDRCLDHCATSEDCTGGDVCNELNHCASPPPETANDPYDDNVQSCALATPRAASTSRASISAIVFGCAMALGALARRVQRIRKRESLRLGAPSAGSLLPARRR